MLSPQSLKPYRQSSISKIILHFHFSLPILLDFVFDLFIKAQTLFPYIISKILILYSHKIFDILQPEYNLIQLILLSGKEVLLIISPHSDSESGRISCQMEITQRYCTKVDVYSKHTWQPIVSIQPGIQDVSTIICACNVSVKWY